MLEKLFGFNKRTMCVRAEILAGITTFLTMAYILAVNPNILSATGMDKGALFTTTVIGSTYDEVFPVRGDWNRLKTLVDLVSHCEKICKFAI